MTDDDHRREQQRPIYDGTGPMVRIVEAMVDLAVLLITGLIRALLEGLRRAFSGTTDLRESEHPAPDEAGDYRNGAQSDRGSSGDRGASDANT